MDFDIRLAPGDNLGIRGPHNFNVRLGQKLRSITKFSCSVQNSPKAMTLLVKNVILRQNFKIKIFKNTFTWAINLKLYQVSCVHKRKFWYQFQQLSINIDRSTKIYIYLREGGIFLFSIIFRVLYLESWFCWWYRR